MCSILGIINFKGLTYDDIEHFRWMFKKAEQRGRDASGVATQDLQFLKWSKPTSEAKKTETFNNFLEFAVGQKWIIGHARAATQGDPSQAINNHPISVEKGKFLLVHNGVVGSKRIVSDDKRTDTYIIAEAIKKRWMDGNMFGSVQEAYKLFYGSAAIAVISHKEIVLARRFNPIVRGVLPSGAIAFGSTDSIVKGKTGKVSDMYLISDDKIIGYDISGRMRVGRLKVVNRPTAFDYNWRSSWARRTDRKIETQTTFSGYGFNRREREGPKETVIWDWDKDITWYKRQKKGPGKGWHKQTKRHKDAAKLGHIRKKHKNGRYYF